MILKDSRFTSHLERMTYVKERNSKLEAGLSNELYMSYIHPTMNTTGTLNLRRRAQS